MSQKSRQQSDGATRAGQFLFCEAEDDKVKIDARLEVETVWLPQELRANLFQTSQQNISLHFRLVCQEDDLLPPATLKKYLLVRPEGDSRCRLYERRCSGLRSEASRPERRAGRRRSASLSACLPDKVPQPAPGTRRLRRQ